MSLINLLQPYQKRSTLGKVTHQDSPQRAPLHTDNILPFRENVYLQGKKWSQENIRWEGANHAQNNERIRK